MKSKMSVVKNIAKSLQGLVFKMYADDRVTYAYGKTAIAVTDQLSKHGF